MYNPESLQMHELLDLIYLFVTQDEDMIEFAPDRKIVLVTGVLTDGTIFNIHPNLFINKKTTLEEYKKMVHKYNQDRHMDYYIHNIIFKVDIILMNPDKDNSKKIKTNNSIKKPSNTRGFHTPSINNYNNRLDTFMDLIVENSIKEQEINTLLDLMIQTYDTNENLDITKFKIIKTYNPKIKGYKITIYNNDLELDDFISIIFKVITTDEEILEYAPDRKLFLATGYMRDKSIFNLHPNILIKKATTLDEYNDKISETIQKRYMDGYLTEDIIKVDIILFNPDNRKESTEFKINSKFKNKNVRGFHTSACNNLGSNKFIKPLKSPYTLNLNNIVAMDIETIASKFDNTQIPIAISIAYKDLKKRHNSKFLLTDVNMLNNIETQEVAINNLFKDLIEVLITIQNDLNSKMVIFTHNLGSFDGFFIFKYLSLILDNNQLNTIIDQHHKFISIEAEIKGITFIWKDSYRLFPVSLNSLCKNFGQLGKTSNYNPVFNTLDFFLEKNRELFKEFKEYSIQDSVSLLKSLLSAQELYKLDYSVDITSIWSTSTLSLKIFRQMFQGDHQIPILNSRLDTFVRNSYFGGSTDYYIPYGENLHYYDVNSLYPYAMLSPMPLNIIKYYSKIEDLDNFFGFCNAEIHCPKDIKIPLLPFKYKFKNKKKQTIHPTGNFIGTYFSEELKAAQNHGYTIRPLDGYEFSKCNLFNKYVEHFYNIKKYSTGSQRFLAKMQLNQLYGYFGRNQELIETKFINSEDLFKYYSTRVVQSTIDITPDKTLILMSQNLNQELIDKLNSEFEDVTIKNSFRNVKSNVALASAVTSYARIEMMKYKTIPGNDAYYTDTDSIFLNKPLPKEMIGDEIGQMKDELSGNIITKAYFLGIKQYGYQYVDNKTNQVVNKSIISGVERNSVHFDDIFKIFNGETLTFKTKTRFYKSFSKLNIVIKNNIEQTIKQTSRKQKLNNKYISHHIVNGDLENVQMLKLKFRQRQFLKNNSK